VVRAGVHQLIRAEQALLGSVLADPGGRAWLLDLVDPDDFTRPYHGQVLAAMNRVRGRGAAPGPQEVREEIRNDADLPRSVSHDGVMLADLIEAVPRPGHGPAYAAMVISTGIRRRMTLAAARMRQARAVRQIEASASDLASPPRTFLRRAADRLGRPAGGLSGQGPHLASGAARPGDQHVPAARRQVQDREPAREAVS
jgi:DnaB-like helicase N terminal domain